jgi:5,10-methylenetetrahydrofolate reductase
VGQVQGDFPERSGRTIHVITAANPYGRPASDEDNDRAHQALLQELREFVTFLAVGGDPGGSHTEQSVAVVGLRDAEAVELGRRFHQDAVFAWTPQSLTLISCESAIEAVRGWCQREVQAGEFQGFE